MYIFLKSQGKIVGAFQAEELKSAHMEDGRCYIKGIYSTETFSIPMTADDFDDLIKQLKSLKVV